MEERQIGLVGLGLLGSALAGRLLAASHQVLGFDIDPLKCKALENAGGQIAADPSHVASRCNRILLSLPATVDVEDVLHSMDAELRPGMTMIDTTTGDPAAVAALGARLVERGVDYLDATISGSSAEASRGEVIVLAGGPKSVFDACEDIWRAFAKEWFHLGGWGSGTKMKLVSNLILGLNRAALAEGLSLARSMGLDGETTLSVLARSAAYSRVMDTKGQKMVTGDFKAQAKLSQHLKDVRLILAEGSRLGISLPLSGVHRQLLERLEAAGLGDLDNSAIIQAFGEGMEGRGTTGSGAH